LVGKHDHFGEILNIFNGLTLFKRMLMQGGVCFRQLSAESLKELKISVPLDYGDILLSILKSQELGLEGSGIAIRPWDRLGLLSWTWPILK
jgi:hypothetical protein